MLVWFPGSQENNILIKLCNKTIYFIDNNLQDLRTMLFTFILRHFSKIGATKVNDGLKIITLTY